jgi:hypothetical protein
VTDIYILMILHFVGDFLLQPRSIARTKSKSIKSLTTHCILYGIPFFVYFNVTFVLYVIMTHWIVDYISSKFTTMFYQANKEYLFYSVIGIDQLIHHIILFNLIGVLS